MPAASSSAAPKRSSRESFIRATARLLRRRGYAATGLNEIVASSRAPKGSLYFHFPGGKEELALAAMERSGGQLRDAIGAVLDANEDLGAGIAMLIDAMAAGLSQSDYRDGCPIATVTLETASESESLQVASAEIFGTWLAALEQRLRTAGYSRAAAERRALLVLSAIEGALLLARARRDIAPLNAVRDELLALSVTAAAPRGL